MTTVANAIDFALAPGTSDAEGQVPFWVLDHVGGVFSFNGAPFYGSLPGVGAPSAARMGIEAKGDGYVVLTDDGRTYDFQP